VAGDGSIAGIGYSSCPADRGDDRSDQHHGPSATINGTVTANGLDIWFTMKVV
jgi:hypothetical protein